MRELRCGGCGRLLGYTQRTQAVPAQCTDPFCAVTPPTTPNEERDSLLEYCFVAEKQTPAALGEALGLTRQRVTQILNQRGV